MLNLLRINFIPFSDFEESFLHNQKSSKNIEGFDKSVRNPCIRLLKKIKV